MPALPSSLALLDRFFMRYKPGGNEAFNLAIVLAEKFLIEDGMVWNFAAYDRMKESSRDIFPWQKIR